jgi:hypothetical protein
LDFRAAIMPIRRAITIIRTDTTSDRTTLIPSRIRTITVAPDTLGTAGVEPTTAIIDIIITITIDLPSVKKLWN